jgi:hypothetical protein
MPILHPIGDRPSMAPRAPLDITGVSHNIHRGTTGMTSFVQPAPDSRPALQSLHLGPQALPAIDKAIQLRGSDPNLVSRRDCLAEQQHKNIISWRAWGFRSWRLQRYMSARQGSLATG